MTENSEAGMGHNNPPSRMEELTDKNKDLLLRLDQVAERANDCGEIDSDEKMQSAVEIIADAKKVARDLDNNRKVIVSPLNDAVKETNGIFKSWTARSKNIETKIGDRVSKYQHQKMEAERKQREEEARAAEEAAAAALQEAQDASHSLDLDGEQAAAKAEAAAQQIEANNARAIAPEPAKVQTESGVSASTRMELTHEIEDITKIPMEQLRPYFTEAEIQKAVRAHVRQHKQSIQIPGVRIFEKPVTTVR